MAPLVETATSDRAIVVIDGCPLECAKQCLDRHDVAPDLHYDLSTEGVPKEYRADYEDDVAASLVRELEANIETLVKGG